MDDTIMAASSDSDFVPVYIDRFNISADDITHILDDGNLRISFLEDHVEYNCRNILRHCQEQICLVRDIYGGAVCVFKIGITHDPVSRFKSYRVDNFDSMYLIHYSGSVDVTNMLEAALIQSNMHITGCRNRNLGGDGSMSRFEPPYFTYIVAARADGRARIGG